MAVSKYILAFLALSGVAAAQGLRVPLLHRDPVDAQRTALHEKLTRLAETRQELGMPEAHTSGELDALTASAQPKPHVAKVASKRVNRPATAAHAWPPPDATWTAGKQEPSLGEVARQYRAKKRQTTSSSKQ